MRGYLGLLRREGDFRRTFVASLISSGGDWFALIPLLTLLARTTHGGLAGSLVLVADTAVFALLSPYAGTVADRVDRRRLMVACESLSAVLVLLLLFVDGGGQTLIAVLAVGGVAAAKAFSTPAASAALPNLVDPPDLARANVLSGTSWGTMLAVGAALGGLAAAAFGTRTCFLIDAVSFAVSAALVARTTRAFQEDRTPGPRAGFKADVGEAADYVRSTPFVLSLLACKPGVAFANGSLVLFPLLAVDVFHAGSLGTGLLFAARGLGALIGPALLVGRAGDDGLHRVLGCCIAAAGVCYLGVSVAPWFWAALVLVVLAHIGGGANWVLSSYGLQRVVPDRVRGRVLSLDFMIVTLAIAANQIVSGLLSQAAPTRTLVACFGGLSVLYAGIWWAATRSVRVPVPQES